MKGQGMSEFPYFNDEEVQEARRYPVMVEWSDADQLFLARTPDLEGLTVHGSTPEEAVANATEAALEWLHGMRAIGASIPTPTSLFAHH